MKVHVNAVFLLQLLQCVLNLPAVCDGKCLHIPYQAHILNGREHIHQHEVLVDHADSVAEGILGRVDPDRLPGKEYLAPVRLIDTVNHIHQRAFTGAVLPKQGMDFSRIYGQVDILIGGKAAECLCYSF